MGVAFTGIQANDPSALHAPNGKSMSIVARLRIMFNGNWHLGVNP